MLGKSLLAVALPYKSAAVALILSVVLGPVGLLYASFWGGIVMIAIGIIVISSRLIFPILLIWIMSCVWSVQAVDSYNRKLVEHYFHAQ